MFEVIVWDYDAAPDAENSYYVAKRLPYANSNVAKNDARCFVNEKSFVGAAVFCEFDKIAGFGLTFDHPDSDMIPEQVDEEQVLNIQDQVEQDLALEKKLSKWR